MTNESMRELVSGIQYRDNAMDLLGEDVLQELEEVYADGRLGKCYTAHCSNGKPVLMGPFRSFLHGFLAGKQMVIESGNC